MHADKADTPRAVEPTVVAAGSHALTILTMEREDMVILAVHGSLDVLTAAHLPAAVHGALTQDPRGLIIDLTSTDGLSWYDCAGQRLGGHAAAPVRCRC